MRALAALALLALAACNSGVGDACKKDSDCSHFDLGYCARARICTRPCGASTPVGAPGHQVSPDCPKDSACADEGPRFVCLLTCKDSNDCAKGFICSDLGTAKVCELATPLAPPPSN